MGVAGKANPDSKPGACLPCWPFKTAGPRVLLTALLEGVRKGTSISKYLTLLDSQSCDGEVSLEPGAASPCPCGLRLSSQLRGGLFPCADRMGLCRVHLSSHPLLILFHHHVNAGGWRQGVKLCLSLSGVSSC